MKRIILIMSCIFICFVNTKQVAAQNNDRPDVIAVAQPDGQAFIYKRAVAPLGYGFNVYRSPDGDKWVKLTDEPFYPAADGFDFKQRVGDDYESLIQTLKVEDPQTIFLSMRDESFSALISSFTRPAVAQAIGRLYIDEDAPVGKKVYYRFIEVNDKDEETGKKIQGRVDLTPLIPPLPTGITAKHEGRRVTVNWNYEPQGDNQAKYVIRFQVLYQKEGGGQLHRANKGFLARTAGDTQFEYTFQIPQLGADYTFTVRAADFTGTMSAASDPVTINIKDNVAPAIIRSVEASTTDDYHSLITWPVSTALDLAGYYIYRARDDSKEYKRITDKLIEPLKTAYVDSTVALGHLYKYRVAAVDVSDNIGKQSNPRTVMISDYRIPDPVTAFNAVYNKETDQVELRWNTEKTTGGLRTFLLLRGQAVPRIDSVFTQINDQQLQDSMFTDHGIGGKNFIDGAVYEYGIAVISQNGNASDTVYTRVKIPDLTPPNAPSLVEAKQRVGRRISLTWNASNSLDVVGYRVYRSEHGADSLLAELRYSQRFYRDQQIPLGRTFVYSVAAVDSAGNESLNPPDATVITRKLHAPSRVRNVQAVETENGVILAWEASSDSLVVAYHIYKSDIPTGVYKSVGQTKDLRWTDANDQAGTWYKVYSVDASGRESRTAAAIQAIKRN